MLALAKPELPEGLSVGARGRCRVREGRSAEGLDYGEYRFRVGRHRGSGDPWIFVYAGRGLAFDCNPSYFGANFTWRLLCR